jgi:hypothetical protein
VQAAKVQGVTRSGEANHGYAEEDFMSFWQQNI